VWIPCYTGRMNATRSAMLQARVYPQIKIASEHILSRIGLTMSEAMELFLRRVIIDEKLPFEVVALEDATLERITRASDRSQKTRKATKRISRPPG